MKSPKILAIAALLFALPFSLRAQTGDARNAQVSQDVNSDNAGQQEAKRMVPASGALLQTIDVSKLGQGSEFKVRLARTVRLDNGPELHSGTVLIGTIIKDDQQTNGSRIALRFTQANLKDGRVVPIKATIVGVARPDVDDSEGYPAEAGDQSPNYWTDKTLKVDQIDVASHVDLHSDIASDDSAVFVSAGNHDLKLPAGSELKLAIAQSAAN
jgi:hypothetical protein